MGWIVIYTKQAAPGATTGEGYSIHEAPTKFAALNFAATKLTEGYVVTEVKTAAGEFPQESISVRAIEALRNPVR